MARRHPIKRARAERGLSHAALAQLTGIPETDLAAIERGARWPTSVEAVRIARHVRLSLAEVLIDVIEAQAAAGHIPPQQIARSA